MFFRFGPIASKLYSCSVPQDKDVRIIWERSVDKLISMKEVITLAGDVDTSDEEFMTAVDLCKSLQLQISSALVFKYMTLRFCEANN